MQFDFEEMHQTEELPLSCQDEVQPAGSHRQGRGGLVKALSLPLKGEQGHVCAGLAFISSNFHPESQPAMPLTELLIECLQAAVPQPYSLLH